MNRSEPPVRDGERFEFGANWKSFLTSVGPSQIDVATQSLQTMLGEDDLSDLALVDVGSGSGLFSLAARRLGARVHSFDFDSQSVAATKELRRRYAADDPDWTVEQGSVLDQPYLEGLGKFDIVYSWGVLHHTGAMWAALENAGSLVAPGGRLYISIYNDQGLQSRLWLAIKRRYNRSTAIGRHGLVWLAGLYFAARRVPSTVVEVARTRARVLSPRARGMSRRHDLVDWVGGYPFEVAPPEAIFDFFRTRGFTLTRLRTCGGGIGCNEFVFEREKQEGRGALKGTH